MKNLLALDQASITTGYAVFKDGALSDYGKFTYDDSDIGERLVKIRKKVLDLIQKHDINEVAFEDIQLQRNVANNVQTFKVLSEVYGVIHELLQEIEIKYSIVPSSSWKSTLGIKGRARAEQKRNAQEWVMNYYGVKATQDTCDAICIGSHILKKPNANVVASDGFDWS